MPEKTLFQKIADREIPATIIHEDDTCFAIEDINPQAPTHLLVIPKQPLPRIAAAQTDNEALLGHLLYTAGKLGERLGPNGFRIVINNGSDGGETVPHLHVHVLAGRPLSWPPG